MATSPNVAVVMGSKSEFSSVTMSNCRQRINMTLFCLAKVFNILILKKQ